MIYDGERKRLDLALASLNPDLSRSVIQQQIKSGNAFVNDTCQMIPKFIVETGDTLVLNYQASTQTEDVPQAIDLDIAYEDESLCIINKAAGLTVHPGAGQHDNTLLNGLLHRYPENKNLPQAGMIHRLDKDTTGLLIIAKTLQAHTKLSAMMQSRKIQKTYLALVEGRIHRPGTIDEPLARHQTNRQKFAVHPYGRPSVTHFKIRERFKHHTLLEVDLETGRTHQIRVHMQHIGHPIVGDPKYGMKRTLKQGSLPTETLKLISDRKKQALHAFALEFLHPVTKETVSVTSPIPEDLQTLLAALRASA